MRATDWIGLGLGLIVQGCGSEVRIASGGGELLPACGSSAPGPASGQERVDLRAHTPGTIIDGRLHVDAQVDGKRSYVVMEMGDGALFIVDEQDALVGPARWVALTSDGMYGRIHRPEQQWQVDVIDVRDPRKPQLLTSHAINGEVPIAYASTYTSHEGHLYFCLQPNSDTGASLVALDLSDPLEPGATTSPPTSACSEGAYDAASTSGALWVSWGVGGSPGGSISTQWLDPINIVSGVSFGYSGDGIHQYGNAQAAATDGKAVVLDTENEDWILVFDAVDKPSGGPYVGFGPAGPKQVLTVDAQVAYFATPSGVHAYDVSDAAGVKLLDEHAEIALAPKDTNFIAVDAAHLIIADSDGRVVLIERQQSGLVQPATVYRGPQTTPIDTEPCFDR